MKVQAWAAAIAIALWAGGAHAQGGVNVNTATKDQLESLPGIGAKIADAIIRDREENGPFSSVEDLTRVPGVTPSLLAKVRASLTTEGGGPAPIVVEEGKVVGADVVKKVMQRFAGEPTIREVQDAAVQHLRGNPEAVDSWYFRARARGLVPELQVNGDVQRDQDQRTVTDTEIDDAPTLYEDVGDTYGLELRARWRLERLVFDPYEAAISRENVRMANLRDRVLDEVTRRYFERRRLQVDLELAPPTELGDRVRKELRLQELTADLDAATGGWFGDKLKAAGRSPY